MITDVFVKRPILASVLSIILLIGGGVAGLSLPITQYPDISPVQITVSASYPGADAQTVADSVASLYTVRAATEVITGYASAG